MDLVNAQAADLQSAGNDSGGGRNG
jgi:hypothetical protein